MIIYTKNVDWEYMKSCVGREELALRYISELIPTWAKCISGIESNQRYYAAVYLRKVLSISFKPRMKLVKALSDGIVLTGIITSFTSLEDILSCVDTDTLSKLLLEDYNALNSQGFM